MLIVNADDFGASHGINRAVAELHALGVVTSASLMIEMPATPDAIAIAWREPGLGVGLHVALTDEDAEPFVDFNDSSAVERAIERQMDRFVGELERLPSHMDAHQNVHRDPRLAPLFVAAAQRYGLPLREHSAVRYFADFYGQWDGIPHPEHIGVESLLAMLESVLDDVPVELSCHPGYVDRDFLSPYHDERDIERRTLAHPKLREFFARRTVRLICFSDVPAGAPASVTP